MKLLKAIKTMNTIPLRKILNNSFVLVVIFVFLLWLVAGYFMLGWHL